MESEIQATIYITPLRNLRLLSISVVDYVQEYTCVPIDECERHNCAYKKANKGLKLCITVVLSCKNVVWSLVMMMMMRKIQRKKKKKFDLE